MIELIARPDAYDGKAVIVAGFAHFEFESQRVYFHREDCERSLKGNSLWVDVPLKPEFLAVNGEYVIVEGTFRNMRSTGPSAGTITNVSRLDRLPSRGDVERRISGER